MMTRQHHNITDVSAAHRPPGGRAGHRAGGEETDSGEQFRVHRSERVESS